MSKRNNGTGGKGTEFIGFDLGHGESAIARSYGGSTKEPEILEQAGERSFVTAVATTKSKSITKKMANPKIGPDIRIGAAAVNVAAIGNDKDQIWVKFKSRDIQNPDAKHPTILFTKTLFKGLEAEHKIDSIKRAHFVVGCPSGWNETDRGHYQQTMQEAGLKTVQIVPESRAALMTALEQGYLSLEAAQDRVLIVDIGSSTTDFTYCTDMQAEDVGHNVLGSGLLDSLIFDRNLARQTHKSKIEKLIERYPYYRPILEYWCRLAKEDFFNGVKDDGDLLLAPAVELIRRLPVAGGVLFEIRMDGTDAQKILSQKIETLNGFSWPQTFDYALRETIDLLGGRQPQTVLLTGGASRLPLVGPACEKIFPDAKIVRGAEPEFAIARGLSWLGRFEHLYEQFQSGVHELIGPNGPVREQARTEVKQLGQILAPVLVDALIKDCVMKCFQQWRSGQIDTLDGIEEALNIEVQNWLQSKAAQTSLKPTIDQWFVGLQRKIETLTDPLCRSHGLPAMVLSLDDDANIAKHLDALSLSAPHLASLENDTALAGTTVSAILVGVLLAKANLLAPLLTNPIGLALGGIIGIGGYVFGKKALEGKIRSAKIPVIARQLMTDARILKSIKSQRADLIENVAGAWTDSVSERFASELVDALSDSLLKRASERAVLFLL